VYFAQASVAWSRRINPGPVYAARAMGRLTERALEDVIAAGCTVCSTRRLKFRTYVDGLIPLQGGEPVGPIKWAYDGEKFCDGVFEIRCGQCDRVLFDEPMCPRCHTPNGLAVALASANTYPVLSSCPGCEGDEVRYIAMIPARVEYEGKRAEKARTATEMDDPGFHGYRVDCKGCGTVAELVDRCPLCDAPGPLRQRPC